MDGKISLSSLIKNASNRRQTILKKNAADLKKKKKEKTKFKCDICQKEFSTQGNLVQHTAVHGDINLDNDSQMTSTFDCTVCGKKFLQKRYLLQHKGRCSPKKIEPKQTHNCALCGKIFTRPSHLRRHESHHLKQHPYVCTLCDRRFVQRYHLERHFKTNNHLEKERQAQKSSVESSPQRRKTTESKSKSINKISTNFRRHKCPFCSKSFPAAWEMQRHWRTVHPYAIRRALAAKPEKPSSNQSGKTIYLLKCTRCGIRFDNDLLYQNHLEWHQGKRPYKCDECHFAFPRRLELENHRAAKHGIGWMFECNDCGEKFAQRTQIDRHWKNQHGSTENKSKSSSSLSSSNMSSSGSILLCKYCHVETFGIANYRDHVSIYHFRKIFIEKSTTTEATTASTEKSSSSIGNDGNFVASDSSVDQTVVQLVVDIEANSKPVHLLRLGPTLPEWLLKLQPSYAMLDVALDEDGGKPLLAGESIVLQLLLTGTITPGSMKSNAIRVSFSVQ